MKRQIIRIVEHFLMLVAVFYATSPCIGKMYDPEIPNELKK